MRNAPQRRKAESFRPTEDEIDALHEAARRAGITRSEFIRRAIRAATDLPAGPPARRAMSKGPHADGAPTWSVDPDLLRVHVELKDLLLQIAEGLAAMPAGQPVDLAMLHCLLCVIDYHLDETLDVHVQRWRHTAEAAARKAGTPPTDGRAAR